MGIKIVLKKGPRYTGIRELIPGHLYRDNKGKEVLFVGFCDLSCPDLDFTYGLGYTYMDFKQVKKKIQQNRLAENLSSFENDPMNVANLFRCSWIPRILVEDLGEVYPSEKFRDMVILQKHATGESYLHIKAIFDAIPFGEVFVN